MLNEKNSGEIMYKLIKKLFPICRSITGNGTRKTLEIISKEISIQTFEIPSNTRVFDWTIPNEWNITDAYIKNKNGIKIIDFKNSNLHVLNYSSPIKKTLTLKELKPHIFTDPEHPDVTPYRTSYYHENWGFCMPHNDFLNLKDEMYEILIDSTLKKGSLSYGEFFVKGKSSEEIIFSCYICHPSMCNDSLSGIALVTQLATYIKNLKNQTNYSYRFLFIPETIGSITWLSLNRNNLKKIKHGLILTCVGDSGNFTYKKTRKENAEIDQTVIDVLKDSTIKHKIIDFFPTGSDERQFCSPGINLEVGCFTRSIFGEFPEYHTSADNLDFIKPKFLNDSFEILKKVLHKLENNHGKSTVKTQSKPKKFSNNTEKVYLNLSPYCEPQLGKRMIYHNTGGFMKDILDKAKFSDQQINDEALLWILSYSDGFHSINDISHMSKINLEILKNAANILEEKKLLKLI